MPNKRTIITKKAKRIRLVFTLAMALLMASCGFFRAPGKDKCDKILSRATMTDILTDIYLLEAYVREQQQIDRSVNDSVNYYYFRLLKQHGVNISDFEAALDCYLLDRQEMEIIHEEMLKRLSIIEGEISVRAADESATMPSVSPD